MAKITKVRVSQLAKELGVPTKEIVSRCESEGIPDVKQPQSTISIGLAQTIREWFGGSGGASVAVQEAPAQTAKATEAGDQPEKKVTAKKLAARPAAEKPAPPVRKAAPKAEPKVAEVPEAPVVDPSTLHAKKKEVAAPSADNDQGADGGAAKTAEAPRVAAEAPKPVAAPPKTFLRPGPPAKANVPTRPTDVRAAGPMLQQPDKTRLSGPRVIRVEKADTLPAPRPRPSMGSGDYRPGSRFGGGGATGGAGAGTAPGAPSRGPDKSAGGRNKRRVIANDGRGRAGEAAPADPWRKQDLKEREERMSSVGFFKKNRVRTTDKKTSAQPVRQMGPVTGVVKISEPINIKELSSVTGVKASDILKRLFMKGTTATINSIISSDQALETMLEFDIELVIEEARSAADIIEAGFKERVRSDERPRSPVVTIMGHVDHGKTSLLDRIRNANVAAGEAGGITQATSAFQTPVKAGDQERVITFIDTPGHEAFTNMRARGAKVTDLVVLVVAADDGVMPQTIESINHAKSAGVPVIVALNKIDKPEATEKNIQRIFGQLAEHGLNPVEWGGQTEVIKTSAAKNTGIQELLDVLDYQAELLGLKADYKGLAQGTVLEAQLEEGRGAVARLIVQEGTLRRSDFVVIGRAFGRVRDLVNDKGQRVDEAGPSTPVAISGIDMMPDAGDKFFCVTSLKDAEEAAEDRRRIERERELAAPKITLDNIFEHMGKEQVKELGLLVKADVQGSMETLRAVLSKIKTDEVAVNVRHAAVGGINESDVSLAEATGSIILGFNVTSSGKARALAERKNVEIRLYEVIYELVDDVTKAASGLLTPEIKLEVLGHAEVREVFKISKVGMIAGCYVTDGVVERNAQIRVTRDGIVVEKDRRLEQLKRLKDDAKEVRAGMECGMKIVGYNDIKTGDVLECYRTSNVTRSMPATR
ncbi:MAG: translation initiation factor IF-2 [Planctomycetes bacterium]|nr:translation initiation factor IF-2 [Planctomycetota bacterium]